LLGGKVELNVAQVIRDFVDHVMPELKPHESAVYLFLLRRSHLESGSESVRVGQRSTAPQYGRGKESAAPSRNQLIKQLKTLAAKGCITIADTNRAGTLYHVRLPGDIPFVKAKLLAAASVVEEEKDDYFTIPSKRREIFEAEQWTCGYCGERVTEVSATLDHIVPQCNGGAHARKNLRTACLICNSIKSGLSEDEAAPLLLKSIRERKRRSLAP
jgi:HNH endonuclease